MVRKFSSSSLRTYDGVQGSSSSVSPRDVRDIGSYGKFMVVMEAVDAIPEALVIAATTADGTMTFSLAASIFFLNVVNTLSTSLDFLAITAETVFPRMMLVLVSFAVGSMAFSISSIMFEGFIVRVAMVGCKACFVGAFYGGIVVGVALVWVLTLIESRIRRRFGVQELQKPFNSATLEQRIRDQMDRDKELVRLLSQRQKDPNARDTCEYYTKRIMKMQNMIDTSESAIELSNRTDLYVAEDASATIQEFLAQQFRQTYDDTVYQGSREYGSFGGGGGGGGGSGVGGLSSMDDDDGDASVFVHDDDGGEGNAPSLDRSDSVASLVENKNGSRRGMCLRRMHKRCHKCCTPLTKRGTKLLVIMTGIFVWTVLLTFAFTPLFALLDSHAASQYLETFADGFSGGAFLALIGSTMIPRMQQDAYRTLWTAHTTKSVGMFGFVVGVVATFSIDLVRTMVVGG